ncbi:M23 family metallopeptidase [Candidatus Thiothrix sp. Deng01]|uniref:M23 family metallopeptidase n=1 Tax=Candidatus Thiothrix phosphatis TaxID=3112415 RepID=A0ABU6CT72_9GAMM|nr:M23 family metallopeptidase [Candidatus Thiothrix sp. Deng01]MEB4589985.1 M23 family metallopeptidase [Candidatus Thiothrix sp. Deng01]
MSDAALSNAQLDAHKELLREMARINRQLQEQKKKTAELSRQQKDGFDAMRDAAEDAKQGIGWALSFAAALAVVYPGINTLHEHANYELSLSGGNALHPFVWTSGTVKDLENWTARKAINWGIEYAGGETSYIFPLSGKPRVTSGFGMRVHPVLGIRKMHNGVDFAATEGTQVLAIQQGIVITVAEDDAAGKYIKIKHANGEVSSYLHLSQQYVEQGDAVSTGQKIGEVGSTGRSTGAHLHLGLQHADGEYYDPMTVVGVTTTAPMWEYFQDVVAASESRGTGDLQAINELGYVGRFQMGTPALCDAGYIKQQVCDAQPVGNKFLEYAGNWTIAGGRESFLKSEGHQKEAYRRWQKRNLMAGRQAGIISDLTPAHKVAGFLHASQFGVGNAIKWYGYGQDSKDANGVNTSEIARRGEDSFKAKYGSSASAATMLGAIEGRQIAQTSSQDGAQGVKMASSGVGASF